MSKGGRPNVLHGLFTESASRVPLLSLSSSPASPRASSILGFRGAGAAFDGFPVVICSPLVEAFVGNPRPW